MNTANERYAKFWAFEQARRKQFSTSYCLHPSAGDLECKGPIVMAHSIQRSGSLTRIAERGHVYRITADADTLKRTAGEPAVKLVGVKRASTFSGMCARHDNLTFAPLESRQFVADEQQCFLLAYRTVLRETYLKRAALNTESALLALARTKPEPERTDKLRFVKAFFGGVRHGLRALETQKTVFDEMLVHSEFGSMRFAVISMQNTPDVMMASAWYPTSDFDGNLLPNLNRLRPGHLTPDTITVSLFGTQDGGACVFSWHQNSDTTCNQFVASLIGQKGDCSDALIRLAFQTSENIYLRPQWWDGLDLDVRAALIARVVHGHSPAQPFGGSDLTDDGHHFASWNPHSSTLRVTHGHQVLVMTQANRHRAAEATASP